jgi:hypothetical protein
LVPGEAAILVGRDRKDASADDIGTYSHDGGYWYGTLGILANGSVTEIPHSHRAPQCSRWLPGTLAQGARRRILALQ